VLGLMCGVIVGGLYAGKTKQSDDESVENVSE